MKKEVGSYRWTAGVGRRVEEIEAGERGVRMIVVC